MSMMLLCGVPGGRLVVRRPAAGDGGCDGDDGRHRVISVVVLEGADALPPAVQDREGLVSVAELPLGGTPLPAVPPAGNVRGPAA